MCSSIVGSIVNSCHIVKFSCSVFATEPVTDNFSVGCEHELV